MSADETVLHPTATVHPQARLEAGVVVGPYCLVGEHVALGRNTRLDAHVVIEGHTEIGPDNVFSPFSVVGTEPQDVSYKGEPTRLEVGAGNVFREFLTIHRGTVKGGGVTRIGNKNYFMAYCHVAHDCQVGNETVFINAATLGGHVVVEDYVMISAFSSVHQFCRIGRYVFVGGYSVVTQDVVPFCRVAGGRPTKFYGLNIVGLRRRGFSNDRIRALKALFQILFLSDLNTSQAVERVLSDLPASEDREELVRFIQASKRGIVKKVGAEWENESA